LGSWYLTVIDVDVTFYLTDLTAIAVY